MNLSRAIRIYSCLVLTLVLGVIILGLMPAGKVAASGPGDLDLTFGTSGTVTTDVNVSTPCTFGEEGTDVAVQPDGKILLSGNTCTGGNSGGAFGLVRYLANGILDGTFGTGGRVLSDLPNDDDRSYGMALQSDGKIVLAGQSRPGGGNANFLLKRFNSNGSLDTTFGIGGVAKITSTGFDIAQDVLIQPDGKILVVGSREVGPSDFMVSRLDSNGALDATFGSGGTVIVNLSAGYDIGYGVALQPDGKIVVAGLVDAFLTNIAKSGVIRLNANGTLDGTFGSGGIVTVNAVAGQPAGGRNVSIQSDGKIVVAGCSASGDCINLSGNPEYMVFRLNGNGSLDSSFGTGGVVTTDVSGGPDLGFDLVILPNGKIAVAGSANGDFRVVLYNNNGSLDTGFGVGGISQSANFSTSSDKAFGIALQADGALVLGGGRALADFAIARYNGVSAALPTQTLTYLGGVLGSGQPIGTIDTTTEFTLNGGASWQPAYLVGTHPWGLAPGTNSWINCGPSSNSCLNQTVDYRVRFIVPSGFQNPQMTFTIIADNAGTFFLNGTQLGSRIEGGPVTFTSTPGSMVVGVNTMIIRVEDWGGLAGFNYRADITVQASSPIVPIALNIPPTVSAASSSVSVNEGLTAANTGTFSDPDGNPVTLSASVGTVTVTGPGSWSWLFPTTDGPVQSQAVIITANDGNGGVANTTFAMTVNNVAPNLTVNVGAGNTVYFVDWTSANPAGGTASGVITLPDGSTVNVTLDALNPDGSHSFFYGAQTSGGTNYWVPNTPYVSPEVPNAPPNSDIIQLSGGNSTIYKVTLSQPIVDPIMDIVSLGSGGNTITYNFNSPFAIVSQGVGYWGGCSTCLVQLPGNVLRGTEGHGTIKFLGTYSTFSWTVPSPEVWHGFTFAIRTTNQLGNINVQEGQTATNSGKWSDPGVNDNVVLSASVGQVTKIAGGTWTWSWVTTDGPAQSQTVTITATDKDGASTNKQFPLTVNNVAPTATLAPITPIAEGSSSFVSLIAPVEPSPADFAGLRYSFACDGQDSSLATTYASASTSNSANCPFTDNGSFPVKARIFDKDNGYSTYQGVAVVNNVAPTATFNVPPIVGGVTPLLISLTNPSDPSVVDTGAGFQYAFDCDNGAGYGAFSSSNSTNCSTTLDGSHTVKGKIKDKDGGFTEYTAVVLVDRTPPEAYNQFDPVTKNVLVFGRDSGSGVPAGPIAPISVVPVKWGNGDDDDDDKEHKDKDDKEKESKAELRTYKITDAAGNTLILVEKVKIAGHEIKVRVVSLQYNNGPIITPPKNKKNFEWSTEKNGTLKELEQKMEVGKGKDKKEVEAKFEGKKNQTTIKIDEPKPETKVVRPGLVLLRMATNKGNLVIEY